MAAAESPTVEAVPLLRYMQLTSYRGMALNATHIYAKLSRSGCGERPGLEVEVVQVLNVAAAAALSRKDQYKWRSGDLSNRFDAKADAHAAAIAVWRTLANPERDALVEGLASIDEPQPVIAGPEEFRAAANLLFEEGEALHRDGSWDRHLDRLDEVCARWTSLLNRFDYRRTGAYTGVLPDTAEAAVVRADGGWQVASPR
jgi:hypothetical protein